MIVLAVASSPLRAQPKPASLDAPNVVAISPRLVTSGQPTAASLATLAAQGFGAVIYLAPPTVPDAVRDEKAIVEGQGLAFVNIPINFGKPVEADFDAFRAALEPPRAADLLRAALSRLDQRDNGRGRCAASS